MLHLLIALQALQVPPPPRGYGTSTAEVVVDAANVLLPETVDRINRIAFDVHAKSGGEMAVVTLPDIGLRAPVDVALQIGAQRAEIHIRRVPLAAAAQMRCEAGPEAGTAKSAILIEHFGHLIGSIA